MRPKFISIDPDNADGNGICATQTPLAAGNFTLDGALVVGGKWNTADNLGRLLSFTSDGADSGDTYTVTGKDIKGADITEALSGPASNTVYSTNYFTEVSQIATDGAGTGNITIGFADDFSTRIIPLNHYNSDPATISIESISGTLDLTGQSTFSEIQNPDATIAWYAVTALTNVSADTRSNITDHAAAFRLISNSYTDTAACTLTIHQNGWIL